MKKLLRWLPVALSAGALIVASLLDDPRPQRPVAGRPPAVVAKGAARL